MKRDDHRLSSRFCRGPRGPHLRATYPWRQCKPKQTLGGTWPPRVGQDILHSECTHTWRTIKGVYTAEEPRSWQRWTRRRLFSSRFKTDLRYLGSSKSRATIVLRLFRFEMFDGHGSNKVCKFVNSIFKVYSFFVRYVLIDFVFLVGFCDGFDDVWVHSFIYIYLCLVVKIDRKVWTCFFWYFEVTLNDILYSFKINLTSW